MEWLAEFGMWFVVVALVLGGPTVYRHYLSHGSAVRRKLTRSERRVRQLREVTERFERLQVEQRSVEARQAALDRNDLEHLAMLQEVCVSLVAEAEAERRAPGTTRSSVISRRCSTRRPRSATSTREAPRSATSSRSASRPGSTNRPGAMRGG